MRVGGCLKNYELVEKNAYIFDYLMLKFWQIFGNSDEGLMLIKARTYEKISHLIGGGILRVKISNPSEGLRVHS